VLLSDCSSIFFSVAPCGHIDLLLKRNVDRIRIGRNEFGESRGNLCLPGTGALLFI
jgi:hypothetical protein